MVVLKRMKSWTRLLVGNPSPVMRLDAQPQLTPVGTQTQPPTVEPEPPEPERFYGYVEGVSADHAEGWAQSLDNPSDRVRFEAVLSSSGHVVGRGVADQFGHGLFTGGVGDGVHAFLIRFDPPLSKAQQAELDIRLPSGQVLPRAPHARTSFEPILHVAMDIVDNCNLRCPFCLFDYTNVHTTHLMTEETIDAALRLLPYTRDGEFWFSCLHEPTLHPRLTQFIDKVPRALRRKLFYTTNLAKRMPDAYFAWLADNAMHHINISIESLQPELYERMRKGARHRIFMENWEKLLAAVPHGKSPPELRYIAMAYRSNLRELPGLVRYLLDERQGSHVELRYTFDMHHLPPDFRESEFLDWDQWLWLRDQVAHFPAERVRVVLPPAPQAPGPTIGAAASPVEPAKCLRDRYLFRMSWDGSVRIVGIADDSRNDACHEMLMLETNVRDIADPVAFFEQLARSASSEQSAL